MNIVIMGAGAIGSLFGAKLSRNNNVILIGRKSHVDAINKSGLKIQGKTNLNVSIEAFKSAKNAFVAPDLLILAVKSYDTVGAMKSIVPMIGNNTFVMSLQNGLDNIEKIEKFVNRKKIMVCITTHGAIFSKPGFIKHTGIGKTVLGVFDEKNKQQIVTISNIFNKSELKTTISNDIIKDIWIKAIVNSSINPLTALFNCKNGYILENPILEKILDKICEESSNIASSYGIDIDSSSMIRKTKEVIRDTYENHSSMLQSVLNCKKTEIDFINGKLVEIGKKQGNKTTMNEILTYSVKTL